MDHSDTGKNGALPHTRESDGVWAMAGNAVGHSSAGMVAAGYEWARYE